MDLGDDESAIRPQVMTHDTEEAFRTINEIEAQRKSGNKKKSFDMKKVIEEEMRETQAEEVGPHESEGLVDWDDSGQSNNRSSSSNKKSTAVAFKGLQIRGSEEGTIPIFAFNGIDDNVS